MWTQEELDKIWFIYMGRQKPYKLMQKNQNKSFYDVVFSIMNGAGNRKKAKLRKEKTRTIVYQLAEYIRLSWVNERKSWIKFDNDNQQTS
jgi:hypothetical protein